MILKPDLREENYMNSINLTNPNEKINVLKKNIEVPTIVIEKAKDTLSNIRVSAENKKTESISK